MPSKLPPMRFLMEEDSFAVVGAFCVAAFALAVVWTLLELMVGLAAAPAGVVAFASAAGAVELISRRHYAPAKPVRPRERWLTAVDAPSGERHGRASGRPREPRGATAASGTPRRASAAAGRARAHRAA